MVIMPDGNIGINETDPDAKLEVNVGSGTTAFEVRGSEGQLFSVTNSLSSGSIFSVNDISGVPSIDVDADGTIELAPFGGTVDVGGNLTVDAGTNTTITVKCDDTGAAGIRLYGDSQGTGYVEVGQSSTYGGGMSYNSDGNPAFASGESNDHITFYNLNAGNQ